jgi:branched-chain amino acid aminotransferase
MARMEALASGADECIMLDIHGYVSEGAGDNIFLVRNGELYTPSVQDALEGITRATVIELAERLKIKVHEAKLTMYDVHVADEIFVTGSGAGIVGVTEVDKRVVSGGKTGPLTKKISDAYDEEAQKGESAYE